MGLRQAAELLAQFQSVEQRLAPAITPQGATFLRDERDGSIDTLRAAFEVLREAEASHKIIILSDGTDSSTKIRQRQRGLAQEAAAIADLVVFVGDSHPHALKGALDAGMPPERAHGFYDLKQAAQYLASELREGDLVLLRGRHMDHLSRLYLAQLGEVSCLRTACSRKSYCDTCPELRVVQPPR